MHPPITLVHNLAIDHDMTAKYCLKRDQVRICQVALSVDAIRFICGQLLQGRLPQDAALSGAVVATCL